MKQSQQDTIDTLQSNFVSMKEQFEEFANTLELVKTRTENVAAKSDIDSLKHEMKFPKSKSITSDHHNETQNANSVNENTCLPTQKPMSPTQNISCIDKRKQSLSETCRSLNDTESHTPDRSVSPAKKNHEVLILGDSVTKGPIRKNAY
jgi:hypothetical protein